MPVTVQRRTSRCSGSAPSAAEKKGAAGSLPLPHRIIAHPAQHDRDEQRGRYGEDAQHRHAGHGAVEPRSHVAYHSENGHQPVVAGDDTDEIVEKVHQHRGQHRPGAPHHGGEHRAEQKGVCKLQYVLMHEREKQRGDQHRLAAAVAIGRDEFPAVHQFLEDGGEHGGEHDVRDEGGDGLHRRRRTARVKAREGEKIVPRVCGKSREQKGGERDDEHTSQIAL